MIDTFYVCFWCAFELKTTWCLVVFHFVGVCVFTENSVNQKCFNMLNKMKKKMSVNFSGGLGNLKTLANH